MFCRKCGELVGDRDKFCTHCGAPLAQDSRQDDPSILNPRHSHAGDCGHSGNVESVSFPEAVKLFFLNYINFKGRSRRSEYWWICLFNMVLSAILTAAAPDIAGLWTVIVCIPTLSLAVRRLHDIGKSGWWYLIGAVPLVGGILLIIWYCKDSEPHANKWGPSPKY